MMIASALNQTRHYIRRGGFSGPPRAAQCPGPAAVTVL
jgi:hypothetical protein